MNISVIIPTFNRSPVISRALRSVLNQKMTGPHTIEVIVADDGSSDNTQELLAKDFPGVRALRWEQQKGPSYARNRAVEAARGDWIAFLDSDDEWKSDKLSRQTAFFEENPDYRICQTDEIWIRNNVRVNAMNQHQKYGGLIYTHCLPLCIISPSAVMLEKKLFEEIGGFDESFPACEDYDLWLRIAALYPVGLIEKKCVLKYGGHADQRSREFPAMDRFRVRALEKILSGGTLSAEQAQQTREMLDYKTGILLTGALKRGHMDEAKQLMDLRKKLVFEAHA